MKRFHLFILVVTMLFAGRHAIFAQATNTAYYATELEQGEIKELLKRFRIDPMNLSTEEAGKLYYGYATSPQFEGDINTALYEVSKLLSAKDFKEAFTVCAKGLKSYPTSIKLLYDAAYICQQLDREEQKDLYQWQFTRLLTAILKSGNGTEESPFHVVSIADEHCIPRVLNARILDIKSVKVGERTLNKVEITPTRSKLYKGNIIWFDIATALKHIDKVFNEKN